MTRYAASLLLGVAVLWLGCRQNTTPVSNQIRTPEQPTFARDITPIIFRKCISCHRPGEAGPFPLLNYADVKKHALQIAEVTKRRFMPPWLPEPGKGAFLEERRLTAQQIETIRRWAEIGAPPGDLAQSPQLPKFAEGWQLGEPDLVLKAQAPYRIRADGPDVYRNIVFRVPLKSVKYVRAVEIRPGDKRLVHHANLLLDSARVLRSRDEKDGQIGFDGMDVRTETQDFEPDTHFLFWKPGSQAYEEPADMAWELKPGTDLILNMHLQPSGKLEPIQPSIGLYFTDRPPDRKPMLVQLEHDGALDIPPGAKNFTIEDELTLPVDCDALAVYPHAHYLGKDLQGWADLPDGTKTWLIHIADWDPAWQGVYRFKQPVKLPQGTKIRLRVTYDNTATNVRNPNSPPQRVKAGNQATDEMGHMWIQLLPRSLPDRDSRRVLQNAVMEQRLRKYPGDFVAHYNLGAFELSAGNTSAAIDHLRKAVVARPDDAVANNSLGSALLRSGDLLQAERVLRVAVKSRQDYTDATYNLGSVLAAKGDFPGAAAQFALVVKAHPDDAEAHANLGAALAQLGQLSKARSEFQRALRISPQQRLAQENLSLLNQMMKQR